MVRTSKMLSRALRHRPEEFGLRLDAGGWADVDALLRACGLTREELHRVVRENDKQRFALSEDGRRIRAVQGHSVAVELGYAPSTPPPVLWHGTHEGAVESILREGLKKGRRQYVHLSGDFETAVRVGRRHGRPVVLRVDTGRCLLRGLEFYLAPNGVWLVDRVPAEALAVVELRA